MRLFLILSLAAFHLAACGGGTQVHVKGGSESAPKWKITKPGYNVSFIGTGCRVVTHRRLGVRPDTNRSARLAELVDARDLKNPLSVRTSRFESGSGHHLDGATSFAQAFALRNFL